MLAMQFISNMRHYQAYIIQAIRHMSRSSGRIYRRIIAVPLLLIFTLFSILPADAGAILTQNETLEPITVRSLLGLEIPPVLGTLSDKYKASGEKLVIHIQDSHAHFQAQRNISKLIGYFFKKFPETLPKLLLLEGAYGSIDTSVLAFLPDKEIRERIANHFLKKGLITGAEYFSIMGEGEARIFGVDDRDLYLKNLNVFKNVHSFNAELNKHLKTLRDFVIQSENYIYPNELIKLKHLRRGYDDGSVLLGDFVSALKEIWHETGNFQILYPNIYKISRITEIEKNLNHETLNQELIDLISLLQKSLVREELDQLIKNSILYKLGKLSKGQYYRHLYEDSSKAKINFSRFPELNVYFEAILLSESLELVPLFSEIEKLDLSLRESLYTDERQRKLDRIDRYLTLIERLILLELSSTDYVLYKHEKNNLGIDQIHHFLSTLASEMKEPYSSENMDTIMQFRDRMEAFYEIALERDQALFENMMERMNQEAAPISLLITGGFHTQGITEGLRDNKISYLVITPQVNTAPNKTAYLSLMMDLSTPLDRELRMIASRLVASIKTAEDPFGDPSVIEQIAGKTVLFREFLAHLLQRGVRGDLLEAYEAYVRDTLGSIQSIEGRAVYNSQQLDAKIARMRRVIDALQIDWDRMLESQGSIFVPVNIKDGKTQLVELRRGERGHVKADLVQESGQLGDDISYQVLDKDLADPYLALSAQDGEVSSYKLNQILKGLSDDRINVLAYIFQGQMDVKAPTGVKRYPRAERFQSFYEKPLQSPLFTDAIKSAFHFKDEPQVRVIEVEVVEELAISDKPQGALESRHDLFHATAVATRNLLKWLNDTRSKYTNEVGDGSATKWLRAYFNQISWMKGKVVIGEGERDEAPMLYIGEEVGLGEERVDMGMDVVEQTKGMSNAELKGTVSIVAYANEGGLVNAPDIYMRKFLVGKEAKGAGIDVSQGMAWNLAKISAQVERPVEELKGAILYRPRHKKIVRDLLLAGLVAEHPDGSLVDANIDANFEKFWSSVKDELEPSGIVRLGNLTLMKDGDLMPVFGLNTGDLDFMTGAGGAPEGTITAAILESLGGEMSAQFSAYEVLKESAEEADLDRDFEKYKDHEKERLAQFGFVEPGTETGDEKPWNYVWNSSELAPGDDIVVVASSVRDSPWIESLKGVKIDEKTGEVSIHSVRVTKSGGAQVIKAVYDIGVTRLEEAIETEVDKNAKLDLMFDLGMLFNRHGLFKRAAEVLADARVLTDKGDMRLKITAMVDYNKAVRVITQGDVEGDPLDKAIEYLSQALRIYPNEDFEVRDLLLHIYVYKARLATKAKELEKIDQYYESAVDILSQRIERWSELEEIIEEWSQARIPFISDSDLFAEHQRRLKQLKKQTWYGILTDIDYSITDKGREVSEEMIEKIIFYLNKGIRVGLVTTRALELNPKHRIIAEDESGKQIGGERDVKEVLDQIKSALGEKRRDLLGLLDIFPEDGAYGFNAADPDTIYDFGVEPLFPDDEVLAQFRAKIASRISEYYEATFSEPFDDEKYLNVKRNNLGIIFPSSEIVKADENFMDGLKLIIGLFFEARGIEVDINDTRHSLEVKRRGANKGLAVAYFGELLGGLPFVSLDDKGQIEGSGYHMVNRFGGISVHHMDKDNAFAVSTELAKNERGQDAWLSTLDELQIEAPSTDVKGLPSPDDFEPDLSRDVFNEQVEVRLGEKMIEGDQALQIEVGGKVIAYARWNEEEGVLKSTPAEPLVTPEDYRTYMGNMLEYLDEWTGKKGKMLEWVDKEGERIHALLNDRTDAKKRDKVPETKYAPLTLGSVETERTWYGYDKLLQVEYGGSKSGNTVQRRPTLLTVKRSEQRGSGGYGFIMQPKKTVMIHGFGTIGSKVGYWARRAGFHVVAAQRSPNERAVYANLLGMPLYLSDARKSLDFKAKDIVYAGSMEALLEAGEVDVIIDATDGKIRYEDEQMRVAEYMKRTIYNRFPGVKVVYQGAEDPEIADRTFEAVTWLMALQNFDLVENDKSLFCPSCNTTMQSNVVSPILRGLYDNAELKGAKLKTYITTTRRTGDPGSSVNGIPADGITIKSKYHHADDVLAVLPDVLSDNIHVHVDGTISFTTDASLGHQTKFHVGQAVLELDHEEGKVLSVEWVKEQLRQGGRIAVIDFPKGKFDSSELIDIVQNKIREVHPFVGVAQVVSLPGGKIKINFLTPQESNVIPNNINAIQSLTGVETSTERSMRFVNDVMDLERIRDRIESYLPESERVYTRSVSRFEREPLLSSYPVHRDLRSWSKGLASFLSETSPVGGVSLNEIGDGFVAYTIEADQLTETSGLQTGETGAYQILEKDGQVFAIAKTTDDGVVHTRSLLDEDYEWEYLHALMGYADILTRSTGEMIEIRDKDGDRLKALLNDVEKNSRIQRDNSPGITEANISIDGLKGTRRWYGDEDLLQVEYSSRPLNEGERSSLLTIKDQDSIGAKPVRFIIQPKKTVLINGFGTIGSEVGLWARRAGYHVVAAQRSPNQRAVYANVLGVPLYLSVPDKLSQFEELGVGFEGELISLLESGEVDVVVDATDGRIEHEGELIRVAEYYKRVLYNRFPKINVIYQGAEDPEIADQVFEAITFLQVAQRTDLVEEGESYFCPSCNTTMQRNIMTPLLKEFKDLDIYIVTTRRTGDPGSSKNSIPADGIPIESGYHHADDFLAGLPDELKDNIKVGPDGKLSYVTDASMGHQTKFHVAQALLEAPGLTAERVKEILSAQGRIAVVDFPKDEFNSSKLIDVVMNKLNVVHPMIGIAQVIDLGGNRVKINFAIPQESNVIPNNLSAIHSVTRVTGLQRSVDFINDLIGLDRIRIGVQRFLPQKPPVSPVSSIESMKLSPLHERYNKTAGIRVDEELVTDQKRIQEEIRARSKKMTLFLQVIKNGQLATKEVTVFVDVPLLVAAEFSDADFIALLEDAIKKDSSINWTDYSGLPDELTIGLLDQSEHLFEDHVVNGFIGINRSFFDLDLDPFDRDNLLKLGLIHELRHESLFLEKSELKEAYIRNRFSVPSGGYVEEGPEGEYVPNPFDDRLFVRRAIESFYKDGKFYKEDILRRVERGLWKMDRHLFKELFSDHSSSQIGTLKNKLDTVLDESSPFYKFLNRWFWLLSALERLPSWLIKTARKGIEAITKRAPGTRLLPIDQAYSPQDIPRDQYVRWNEIDYQKLDKPVLVAANFDVVKGGKIKDPTKVLEGIRDLEGVKAPLVFVSHNGRPAIHGVEGLSLEPVRDFLQEQWPHREVIMASGLTGSEVELMILELKPNQVLLLENFRFDPRSESPDASLREELAKEIVMGSVGEPLFSLYMNNDFASAPRFGPESPSTRVIDFVKFLPSVAGPLLERELRMLEPARSVSDHPFVLIIGGSKVGDKIQAIKNPLAKMQAGDTLVIGGQMAFTFLRAKAELDGQSIDLGASRVEEDFVQEVREILEIARDKGVEVILPEDHVLTDNVDEPTQVRNSIDVNIPEGLVGADIGPKTVKKIVSVLKKSRLFFWNGPVGAFENDAFAEGSNAISRAGADTVERGATGIIGGGDTLAAIDKAGTKGRFSHESTGGGSAIQIVGLQDGEDWIPVQALKDAVVSTRARVPLVLRQDQTKLPSVVKEINTAVEQGSVIDLGADSYEQLETQLRTQMLNPIKMKRLVEYLKRVFPHRGFNALNVATAMNRAAEKLGTEYKVRLIQNNEDYGFRPSENEMVLDDGTAVNVPAIFEWVTTEDGQKYINIKYRFYKRHGNESLLAQLLFHPIFEDPEILDILGLNVEEAHGFANVMEWSMNKEIDNGYVSDLNIRFIDFLSSELGLDYALSLLKYHASDPLNHFRIWVANWITMRFRFSDLRRGLVELLNQVKDRVQNMAFVGMLQESDDPVISQIAENALAYHVVSRLRELPIPQFRQVFTDAVLANFELDGRDRAHITPDLISVLLARDATASVKILDNILSEVDLDLLINYLGTAYTNLLERDVVLERLGQDTKGLVIGLESFLRKGDVLIDLEVRSVLGAEGELTSLDEVDPSRTLQTYRLAGLRYIFIPALLADATVQMAREGQFSLEYLERYDVGLHEMASLVRLTPNFLENVQTTMERSEPSDDPFMSGHVSEVAKQEVDAKVISVDLTMLAEITQTDGKLEITPKDFAHKLRAFKQKISQVRGPNGQPIYKLVLYSDFPGTEEILAKLGFEKNDFDRVYHYSELQALHSEDRALEHIGPSLVDIIEMDFGNEGVRNTENDIILLYPEVMRSRYGTEEALRDILHLMVAKAGENEITDIGRILSTAADVLASDGEISNELLDLLKDEDLPEAIVGGFRMPPMSKPAEYIERLHRARRAIDTAA